MGWLLNTVYACFLVVVSPWLLWRFLSSGKNKRGWTHKLLGLVAVRESTNPCIWLHAVSVGEVNLLAPILHELKIRHPDFDFVISTTTETGFDLASKKYPDHYAFFCPLDFTWAINRALKRIRPTMLVLAELELWPNLIRTARRAGVPVAVVNGRLSANSFRGYQRFRWLVRGTFENLSMVAAQNETYAQRFRKLGCDPSNVFVTGSVKFDGVETNRSNARSLKLAQIAEIDPSDQVFVAGSTQVEEDLMVARIYQQLGQTNSNLRLILVPRHPERCGALRNELNQLGIPSVLRSGLDSGFNQKNNSDSLGRFIPRDKGSVPALRPVLIVDVIGELGAWWGCADATYVGGSLGRRGGQNMIEPAAFGLPVSFGPKTENFREITQELIDHDAATVIYDQTTLQAFIKRAFTQPDWAVEIGCRAKNVVMNHLGASQRTVEVLSESLQKPIQTPTDSEAASSRAA